VGGTPAAMKSAYPESPEAPLTAGDRGLALLVALLVTGLLSPGIFWGLSSSKAAVGGLRVLAGDVPYRDFWSLYAPGQFYLVAGLFRLFGREFLVQSVASIVVTGISSGVLFGLLRRLGTTRRLAVFLALAFGGMFVRAGVQLDSYGPALLGILIGLDRGLEYFRRGGAGRLLAAGYAFGCAAVFKHDVAAYAAVALGAAVVFAWFGVSERPGGWSPPLAALLRLAAGCAMVVVPVVLWLATVAGHDAWVDLIAFPATDFRAVRGESYPPLVPALEPWSAWAGDWQNIRLARNALGSLSGWLVCHLPELVFVLAVAWLVLRSRRARPAAVGAVLFALFAMPFFWYAAHVQRNTHVYSMATLAAVVFAAVVSTERPGSGWARALRVVAVPFVLLYAVAFAVPAAESVWPVVSAWQRLGWPGGRELPFPGARHVLVSPRESDYFVPVVEFLRTNTAPDERIHVGLKRHDAVVIGNQRFYLLADRRPATRYNELHPGVADRDVVQREMIADLARHDVRCIVLWNFGGPDPDWSNVRLDEFKARRMARLPGTGSTLLDEYIAEHYAVVATYDEYDILWRRDLPEPSGGS